MSTEIEIVEPKSSPLARITRAESDEELVRSRLRTRTNKSPETYRAYERDAGAFLPFVGRPLRAGAFVWIGGRSIET
jgi:hypothetical protein